MFKLQEYAKSDYWSFAFSLSNPGEYYEKGDYRTNYCNLHFALFGHSWWFRIPELFKPRKKWVDTSKYEWSTNPKGGYWEYIKREYGIYMAEDAIHIRYGIQPGCWSSRDKKNSDHSKVLWIPWKHMTYQHEKFFTPDWHFYDIVHPKNRRGALNFEMERQVRDNVPKIKFKFNDYDGEEIIATCYISQRVWRRGTSWCKWIGYIRKPLERYYLDIEFSKEVGYEKGSWKGGTVGHSIEIGYLENPLEAFKRYGSAEDCYKNHGRKNRGFTNIEVVL